MIKEARVELATAMTEALDFTVHPNMPGNIQPNVGFIMPGAPYLETGKTFGRYRINLEIHLVFRPLAAAAALNTLDDTVDDAIAAALEADWTFVAVGQPYGLEVGDQSQFLAVPITVSSPLAP